MRKIFQKWPLGGVLGLILLSVSVSTSCMQGNGQVLMLKAWASSILTYM